MRFILLLIVFLVCSRFPAHANLLWQATKGDQTVYVLAHIPFSSPGMLVHINTHVNEALGESDVVVFASNPEASSESALNNLLAEQGVYHEGESLSQNMTIRLKRLFDEVCEDLKIPAANLERLKPWMAARSIQQLALVRAHVRLADRLDRHMHRTAINDGKDLAYLSTPRDVLDMYLSMESDEHIQLLITTLELARRMPEYVAAMESAWLNRDAAAAATLIEGVYGRFPMVYDTVLTARNKAWASQLNALSALNGTVLAVLPIENMAGDENLLEQLQVEGFVVIALPESP